VATAKRGLVQAAMSGASRILSSLQPSNVLSRSIPILSGSSQTDSGIRYLTVQDLVELHRAVSAEFGGNQAQPGVVESQFGLLNAVQRPQITTLGREAYATFPDKVAAFIFALLSSRPFKGGNKRVAFASLFAFCEINGKNIDSRIFDEKTAETVFKRAASHRELGIPPENVFREFKELMTRAIVEA
jgi:death-on-curing protein